MDNLRLWHKFLQIIKSEITADNFKAYFLKTLLKSVMEDKILLTVPSAFILETLNRDYKKITETTFTNLLGRQVIVEFAVKEFEDDAENQEENLFQPLSIQATSLNPKYTLENFVVGPSNNLAYAAAEAVVQNPGTSYNPLFIYGGTGVGKTHLMLGIGNAILKKRSTLKVNYCSSEKFTNDYVQALQTKQFGSFRSRYRGVDILLIDDVQFFSGREGTQEEFFHTFNELSAKNSQIVITSDRPPFEIDKLENRLKSRFQGGLMVDMQIPDFDTRVAILKTKCSEQQGFLSLDCLNLIAQSVESNARELEGRLIQVLQALKTKNLEPTVENVRSLLGQKVETDLKNLSPKQVIIKVCEYFDVKQTDLVGPRRVKGLVLPRHLAMYLLSEQLNLTVEKIGQVLGGRDHTTVMHGRDRIKKLVLTDRGVQKNLFDIKQALST